MDRLFAARQFADFGPDYLHGRVTPSHFQRVDGGKASALKSKVRQLGPNKPGVYGMLDRHGDLIYVGKAKNLRSRLLSYFRSKSRDPKAGRIIAHAVALVWEIGSSEFAALHRELELIRRWRPRFNVHGQPRSHQPTYLCLGRAPAPYVFLARKPPARDLMAFYGPVPAGYRAGEAVRRLNDVFQLRDCPQSQKMNFADQGELFPVEHSPGCLRYEIGTCLGPCAAGCTRSRYFAEARKVQAFLEGTDVAVLDALARQIEEAAERQIYERAAALRDKHRALAWLHHHLERTRLLQASGSFLYPAQGHDGRTVWYLIRRGQTVASVADPETDRQRREAKALVQSVYQKEYTQTREQAFLQRDSLLLVASWFRRYPDERDKTLTPEAAAALWQTAETEGETPKT